MKPPQIQRLLFMRKDERGNTLTQAGFRKQYGFEPDGVNAYYGINAAAVQRLKSTGSALNDIHRTVFGDVRDALIHGSIQEKWVDLGLWPFEPAEPYAFVDANLPLVERLAAELAGFQEEAHQWGKELRIVVRYASEMNDPAKPGQPWGRGPLDDPAQQRAFKESYVKVREVFRKGAPAIRFSFAPALRKDNAGERYRIIRDYWPGDGEVDVVGCTWYVGRIDDLEGAVDGLRRYVADWKPKNLPFGFDELGGCHNGGSNDCILMAMLGALGDVHFEYASIFLEGRWGVDATLDFLR